MEIIETMLKITGAIGGAVGGIIAIYKLICALIKRECDKHFTKDRYYNELKEKFATTDDLFRLDAHLSRMNAIGLSNKLDECYIWSIGLGIQNIKKIRAFAYQRYFDL